MRIYERFKIEIYNSQCHVICCDTMADSQKLMGEKVRLFTDEDMSNGCAWYVYSPGAGIVLLFSTESKRLLANVYHEVSHGTFHLLDDRGMKHDPNSDEAYAYLGAFIFEKTVSILKKNGAI